MQEWLASMLAQYASFAPLTVFLALVIAAFNIPISEDLTVIAAGLFVATVAPDTAPIVSWMHLALIAGAIGGDMLSYTLGRKIGRPLLRMRLFRRVFPERRLELLSLHFAKHSTLTILLGRLIPFGVRNGISLFAGITRLSAWKFLLLDTIPGAFSISVIYWLSRRYSQQLLQDIRIVQIILLLVFAGTVAYIITRIYQKHKQHRQSEAKQSFEQSTKLPQGQPAEPVAEQQRASG